MTTTLQQEPTVVRELFGGAVTASLPVRYVDVSDFRPVPDNQEVWTDANRQGQLTTFVVHFFSAQLRFSA